MEESLDFINSSVSLQDSFNKFRKLRLTEKRKVNSSPKIRTQEDQDRLRQKFLERAYSYIGVPYAKRYHPEGSEFHNSPLFLDCCALVRKVVKDLKEDFGFSLGRWNQAYQFDMLPQSIAFEDMKPGDLIFYSGTYFDAKKKRQIHDMVHVEIFIGGPTGEQSLGARWYRGTIQVFDSYKFTSTSYYDIQFHYKSIDSWLQGNLHSHCLVHSWNDSFVWSQKNSVFALPVDAEEEDASTEPTTPSD
mmetsp:Transcript_32556/g.56332  ORF Transcript_32556/g.56332 Transcript_32556/m.56332 type:complete len:246 (-) Transcript_32556:1276-2013(-)